MPKGPKKGKESDGLGPKFVPMPSHWPGKLSDPDLFAMFAKQVRLETEAKKEYPLVALKIVHLGLKGFRDFIIVVPKDTTIYRLQSEISRIGFDSGVPPSDIIVFHRRVESPFETIQKRIVNFEVTGENIPTPNDGESDDISIGVAPEFICKDSGQTLLHCFPDIRAIRLPDHIVQCNEPIYTRELSLQQQTPIFKGTRARRYNDVCRDDLDQIETEPSQTQHRHAAIAQEAFSIYFDVKRYGKITTYKNNFATLLLHNPSWITLPTSLSAAREVIHTNHVDPYYIRCPLLLFENDKVEKQKPASLVTVFSSVSDSRPKPKKTPAKGDSKPALKLNTTAEVKTKSASSKLGLSGEYPQTPPYTAGSATAALFPSTIPINGGSGQRSAVYSDTLKSSLVTELGMIKEELTQNGAKASEKLSSIE
ncbi:hypothetical protein HDV03_000812 [Kappamyces sp. JEL0829]|nr:hypothetical protein HDV03_000812 [Kappamyces sp. JEL0829]